MKNLMTKIKQIAKNIAIVTIKKGLAEYPESNGRVICESYKVNFFGITLFRFSNELNSKDC